MLFLTVRLGDLNTMMWKSFYFQREYVVSMERTRRRTLDFLREFPSSLVLDRRHILDDGYVNENYAIRVDQDSVDPEDSRFDLPLPKDIMFSVLDG